MCLKHKVPNIVGRPRNLYLLSWHKMVSGRRSLKLSSSDEEACKSFLALEKEIAKMCNFCSTIIQELHLLPWGNWKNREKAVAPCSCRQNYKKDERDSRTQRDFCSKNPVSSFPSYAYFFLACIWESGNHVLWLRFSATSSHALVCCSLAFSRGQYLKESTLTQCQTRMKCSLDTKRNFLGEEEGSRIFCPTFEEENYVT